jgi:response regulator of citrate/malate metabolism
MFDPEFSVDRYNLELEAERQSDLMRKWTKRQARYKNLLKKSQKALDILEGELSEEYRRNKKTYGIQKDTDQVIFRLIKGDPKYEKQYNEVMKYQVLYDDAKSAVESIVEKGWMIKELVKLWLNNYYSTPIVKEHDVKPKRFNLKED